MSRTDKDVPYRVHLARSGRELHDHRFGPCDLDEWTPDRYWAIRQRGTSCRRVEGNNYFHDTLSLYSRAKAVGEYVQFHEGARRERLRRDASRIRKMYNAGEDVSDEEIVSTQTRHSAIWEAW